MKSMSLLLSSNRLMSTHRLETQSLQRLKGLKRMRNVLLKRLLGGPSKQKHVKVSVKQLTRNMSHELWLKTS